MVVVIPDEWHPKIEDIVLKYSPGGKIVVLGAKGAGKSTFVRLLSDAFLKSKLVESVGILETDCGQPDKSPPGTLNLLYKSDAGGRCVHRIVSQRFLGFVNPGSDPFAYTSLVEDIFADFGDSQLPLIVNCHGWSTGCGRETWDAVVSIVVPDLVVHIGQEDDGLFTASSVFGYTGLSSVLCMAVCKVITVEDDEKFHQLGSSDKRWAKIASHFRPCTFVASTLRDFFQSKFIARIDLCGKRLVVNGGDLCGVSDWSLVEKRLVGLCAKGQFVCLGFVDTQTYVFVPRRIPHKYICEIDEIVCGSDLSWTPRDSVCFRGKRTIVNFDDRDDFFLPHVLGGNGAARTASTRTNLKRQHT